MLGRLRNSYAEIDLSAVEKNFLALQGLLKTGAMAPMVKADAYGHGDIQVARVCEKLGARFLGVALIEEGIRLRLAGIQTPILVFGTFDSIGAEAMVKYRLTPVLSSFDQIPKLKTAIHETASFPVHIKFNTGMQRLGFEPEEATQAAQALCEETYFKIEGVCTHFVSSDDFQNSEGETQSQVSIFQKIISDVKKVSRESFLSHYLNSAAILGGLEPQLDLARPGIALYGVLPKLSKKPLAQVTPAMSVKSSVGFIHHVKKGAKVSYGGTWRASENSVIAVIPFGYADGLPRALSNKGRVLIRGEFCPITGIICMDYFMVDVTSLVSKDMGPEVGDEVVILGQQNENIILVQDIATEAGTIPYEILTGMQGRLPRIYIH